MTVRITNWRVYTANAVTTPSHNEQQPLLHANEAVVLIHGLNGNLLTFGDVAPRLARSLKAVPVVALDQTSHGANRDVSANDEEDLFDALRPNCLARDVHDLLTSLGFFSTTTTTTTTKTKLQPQPQPRVVHLFGQSHGGRTACAFAERYPGAVASLALGDIGIRPCPAPGLRGADRAATRRIADEARATHTDLFPDEASARNYVSKVFAIGDNIDRKLAKDVEHDDCVRVLVRPHVGLVHDFVARRTDFRDLFAELDAPTLVLRAGPDASCVGDDEWELMKELRREAAVAAERNPATWNRFVQTEGEHGVHRSHCDLWVEVVSEFVRSAAR